MATLEATARMVRLLLIAASLMGLMAWSSVAVAAPADRCESVRLLSPPTWVVSGGWSGDQSGELVLLDPSQKSLLRYGSDGRLMANARRGSAEEVLSSLGPVVAWPLPEGGLVVADVARVLYRLGPGLGRLTHRRDIAADAGLASIFPYRWGLTDDSLTEGGMVMCGEIELAPDDWSSPGLFYLPLAGDERRPVVLKNFAEDKDPGILRLGCRFGGQVVAAVDGTAYVLLFSEPPGIYRVNPDSTVDESKRLQRLDLDPVPLALQDRPPLPSLVLIQEYAALMNEVERATMPVELIGWKDQLFLLMRRPDEVAGTRWSLAKITLGEDDKATVEVAELRSVAKHISIIPGPNRWAFVEKDSPRALGDQDVLGIKYVPTALILGLKDGSDLCP